jgi:homoserine dehydrogenase
MISNKAEAIVLKFGSSVLHSEKDLPIAVEEIYRWWRDGWSVIAVVSAFADATDRLMRLARKVCEQPEKSAALALLLASGEATSSALLGLALYKAGISARVLDAAQAGLRTSGGRLDAELVAVDSARLLADARRGVIVLPGFVGRGEDGGTTLLGRGGSDYSALFLAHRLSARCVLLKDVDGLYTSDPADTTMLASRFVWVSYDTALRLGGSLVQQKAIRFAAAHKLRFTITSVGGKSETEVGPFVDQLDAAASSGIAAETPSQLTREGCIA